MLKERLHATAGLARRRGPAGVLDAAQPDDLIHTGDVTQHTTVTVSSSSPMITSSMM